MRSAEEWLRLYARTHQNPLNKRIHWFCVPLIFWSVVALLWVMPKPEIFNRIPFLNWAILAIAGAMAFYLRLGFRHFLGMLGVAGLALAISALIKQAGFPLAWIAGAVFALAWIGQFYGHKIEGRKPSFFEDLLFLLIGPLWILEQVRKK